MSRRGWWIGAFLAATATAVGAELVAATDHSPDTVPWTELLTDLPWWVTMPAALLLAVWLPIHLALRYRRRRAGTAPQPLRQGGVMQPAPPTQTRHPWRATARTVFAAAVAFASLAPVVAATAHVDAVPAVVQVLAVAGAITRVLAMPAVDGWLRRYLPLLATTPAPKARQR